METDEKAIARAEWEYETRELASAARHLANLARAPIAHRREGREEFREVLAERPQILGERIEWIFAGHYGRGPQMMAENILRTRCNRVVQASVLAAAFEWHCPSRFAHDAWKGLTSEQRERADAYVAEALAKAAAR